MNIVLILVAMLLGMAGSAVLYLKFRMDHARDEKDLEAAIDAEIRQFMKSGRFPAVVVGVFKDGRRFIKGYGTVDKASAVVPDAATVFQIGSVTKILTASLLQSLCDEGLVSMDTTLGELLGHQMPLAPSVQSVTLRQLATHTSGFPSIPRSLGDQAGQAAGQDDPLLDPYSHLGPPFVWDYLATAKDSSEAGRFAYSNFGMGLLAHVLEVVTGQSYEALVKEKLLLPLGMTSTTITLAPDMKARMAQGYSAKGLPTPVWTFAALAGAGAFSSSAEDLLTFVQASLEADGPASQRFQAMRVPQFGGDAGTGWLQPTFLHRFFGNKGVVWHNGMVGGYAAYLSIDEASRSGVVVLTNQASATDMLGMMLMRRVRTQSWAPRALSDPSHQQAGSGHH